MEGAVLVAAIAACSAMFTGIVQVVLALLSRHDREVQHQETTSGIASIRVEINGRMQQLLNRTREASELRGYKDGVEETRAQVLGIGQPEGPVLPIIKPTTEDPPKKP